MKIVKKLGISVLALLLVTVGTAMAVYGGSSYNTAKSINVPFETYDIFGPYNRYYASDWWKFTAGDDGVYIELDEIYKNGTAQGEMLLWATSTYKVAHVSTTQDDHLGIVRPDPQPRIQIKGRTGTNYDFLVGRNWHP